MLSASSSSLTFCLALREVAEYLAGQNLSVDVDTVSFAMHFPRYALLHGQFDIHIEAVLERPSHVQISKSRYEILALLPLRYVFFRPLTPHN